MRERENPSRKVRVSDEIHYVQRGLVFDFVLGCCCDHRHWFGRWGGRENCGKRGKDMKLGNPFVCRLNKEMGIFGGWSERERERDVEGGYGEEVSAGGSRRTRGSAFETLKIVVGVNFQYFVFCPTSLS